MKKFILFLALAMAAMTNANATSVNEINDSPIEYNYNTQSASLTISNRSDYTITVKVMNVNGGLYTTRCIGPRSSSTVGFGSSGYYYTKTKAEKAYSGTLYRKGGSFKVQNDSFGYTQGTLEFYVSGGYGTSGQSISRAEFEKNY